jgi:hypothetical protein
LVGKKETPEIRQPAYQPSLDGAMPAISFVLEFPRRLITISDATGTLPQPKKRYSRSNLSEPKNLIADMNS